VPNELLRDRYLELREEDDRITNTVCTFMVSQGYPSYLRREGRDGSYLRRVLGLTRTSGDKRSGNPGLFRQHIRYEEAVALSRALGMAPVDAGV
jgi:hypothetical protein